MSATADGIRWPLRKKQATRERRFFDGKHALGPPRT
jgi:hypothetical protein